MLLCLVDMLAATFLLFCEIKQDENNNGYFGVYQELPMSDNMDHWMK